LNKPKHFGQNYLKNFIRKNLISGRFITKEDLQYVGHAGIYPRPTRKEDWEFVYFLRRDAWGKGYATEIARRIIQYGFEDLRLPEVFATVDDDHFASIRVLEKSGMKFERFETDDDSRFSVYSVEKINRNKR